MIEIPLTQGKVALIDDIDGDLLDFKWYADNNRARRQVDQRGVFLHRVILARKLERDLLETEYCDHINCNSLDNRRENLRLATKAENLRNTRKYKNNKSGYKGVFFEKRTGKYIVHIMVNRKYLHLGCFNDPKEAHDVYCEAALKYFGEFARFE